MHQKQRLKNLERFRENPRGVLLASDVASRGLDIPDVQCVIHYQVLFLSLKLHFLMTWELGKLVFEAVYAFSQ